MALGNKYFDVDFDGFSSNQMHGLLYSTFDEKQSPLILANDIDGKLISNVSFNNHVINYLLKLKEEEPLKLTQKGNLPRKFCREFLEDNFTDSSSKTYIEKHPIMKEEDSFYIRLINILTDFSGFTKKVYGKKSLTKKCNKLLASESPYQIYRDLFLTYTRKLNWGYFDAYPEASIIQNGFGFSIFLVQKYGDKPKEGKSYSNKFLRAFPMTIDGFSDNPYFTGKSRYETCYYLRTFDRFLYRFGLIDIEKKGKFPSEQRFIIKKDLLDILIKWQF